VEIEITVIEIIIAETIENLEKRINSFKIYLKTVSKRRRFFY